MKPIEQLIAVNQGGAQPDLILKNASVFNVFTGRFIQGDVGIVAGYVAGIGSYQGKHELDLDGCYITPGFIDGHVHMESSMVSPAEFARAVVPVGTTAVVADPHEIANVAGVAGIQYILDASAELPINVYVMLPSCVPSSPWETSGAVLDAKELAPLWEQCRVLGLGELMDYQGVLQQQAKVMDKVKAAAVRIIDGHAPGLTGGALAAYAAAGIRSDHECVTPAEARERLNLGMRVMLREGSACKNLLDLLPAVDRYTARRCMFVTDDRHPEDLIACGHINHMVKLAVDAGADMATTLQMATLNAAEYFSLADIGAIAPGYRADLLVFDNLTDWRPAMVFKDGRLVAQNGRPLFAGSAVNDGAVRNTCRLGLLAADKLNIRAAGDIARVIGLVPHQIITEELRLPLPVKDGCFVPDAANDILKIAVFERHHATGNIGAALVSGLGLREGAIASSVSHDAHNIIAIGANDEDILTAVAEIGALQGGLVIVREGKVVGSLALPIAGLMSEKDIMAVQAELATLHDIARALGVKPDYDPFMTLAFLSLPVIPALKVTDLGLVDVCQPGIVSVSLK